MRILKRLLGALLALCVLAWVGLTAWAYWPGAPEIAVALDVKLNTVYSRLRAARAEFERAVAEDVRESRSVG